MRTAGCPGITVADVVQIAGAAAVTYFGGPKCPLLMGRPDSGPTSTDSTEYLPNDKYACDNATDGIRRFTRMGFVDPVATLVVLSGAHNIGHSRLTVESGCSKGLGPFTAPPKHHTFDGHYYTEVVQQTGRGG